MRERGDHSKKAPCKNGHSDLKGILSEGHGRSCHWRHDIFPRHFVAMVAFLPWLPWHCSHLFAMAPIAFFHAQTAKWKKWPD